jgi:ribonuclease HI
VKFTAKITFNAVNRETAKTVLGELKDILAEANWAGVDVALELAGEAETYVYTDGGCDMKRGGVGAWAYLIRLPSGGMVEQCEGMLATTNNRMELMAATKALEVLEIGPPVKIVTDSEYLIRGLTQWSRNWRRNGWKTYAGQPVMNKDLWEPLIALYELHKVTFEHVKGHTGHPENEHVDSLCTSKLNDCHTLATQGKFAVMDQAA